MAGREELYLKRIAENTERIAKALEKLAEARTVKDVKFDSDGLKLTYENAMQLQNWLSGYTATKKDDAKYYVCKGCLNEFDREGAKKVEMICPDCHLALVPLKNVLEEEPNDKSGWDPLWDGR